VLGSALKLKCSADKCVCIQMSMDNPEWFYRHVEMHAHCLEAIEDNVLFCGWKGKKQLQSPFTVHNNILKPYDFSSYL